MKRFFQQHEFALLVLLILLCSGIGLKNPAFLSPENIFSLLKSSVVPGMFAIGVLIVLISGNIDISFPAIAVFAMYLTCLLANTVGTIDHMLFLFSLAAVIGGVLGMINAIFVHHFKMPALIVTLGTVSLIRGALLAFIGTKIITNLPSSMVAFSKILLFERQLSSGGTTGLSLSVGILIAVFVFAWFLLEHTLLGRGIYAIGGNFEGAERIGFNIRFIQYFIYVFAGALAGVTGIIHSSHMRNASPFDIIGIELTVIAAVVLGGADIFGGRGTVLGTILGVLLLVVINNSLILSGVPVEWQKVAIGVIIIGSTALTAWRTRKRASRLRITT